MLLRASGYRKNPRRETAGEKDALNLCTNPLLSSSWMAMTLTLVVKGFYSNPPPQPSLQIKLTGVCFVFPDHSAPHSQKLQ